MLHFLVLAKPGMGKSSSMAMLAMKWVKDKDKGKLMFNLLNQIELDCTFFLFVNHEIHWGLYNMILCIALLVSCFFLDCVMLVVSLNSIKLKMDQLKFLSEFPFDFVFLIPLRNVDENCSLAQLVVNEHDIEKEDTELVKSILIGQTNHKVLLLLDGYDEYTPGTNTDIDRAIEKTVGKRLLLLTSRPKEEKDFTVKIRNKMDAELEIRGFNNANIWECCSKYLESEQEADKFLEEAKTKAGLYELFKVPIILLMTSVLYNEDDKKSLPERKTQLYEDIYEFVMDRSALKPNNYGCYSSEIPNINSMLITLGRFAWEALQSDVKQLLINKVRSRTIPHSVS